MAEETLKDRVIEEVQKLPDDATFEDIMERLYFIHKVEKGLNQVKEGKSVPHDDVKRSL